MHLDVFRLKDNASEGIPAMPVVARWKVEEGYSYESFKCFIDECRKWRTGGLEYLEPCAHTDCMY